MLGGRLYISVYLLAFLRSPFNKWGLQGILMYSGHGCRATATVEVNIKVVAFGKKAEIHQ